MSVNPPPYALGSEEGEALWFFGMLATMKATAEQTGGEFILVEEVAPKGMATPLHVHPTDDESFYVLEGEMTFYLEDGQPIPASAGSFVHIPKGYVPHAFQVDSETARFLSLPGRHGGHAPWGCGRTSRRRPVWVDHLRGRTSSLLLGCRTTRRPSDGHEEV